MFEFGALPPEINSGWIYTGPGSAPMMAAATAWRVLAAELGSTAAGYQGVVTRLAAEQWTGPSAAGMAAATAPYLAWMNTTSAQAEQAATQATAAAAAFEAAHAAVVPPPLIAANRSLLMALVATNFLGQNTPAIMATEAHYAEMWAQDAAAMFGYAGSSATAAQVTPFSQPTPATNPAGLGSQAAAVAQATGSAAGSHTEIAQLISALPATLQSLSSPLQSGTPSSTTSGLSGILSGLFNPSSLTDNVNGMVNAGAWNIASTFSTALGFLGSMGGRAGSSVGSALSGGLVASTGTGGFSSLGGLAGGTVLAGSGQAGSIGALSAPPTWAASSPVGAGSAVLQSAASTAAAAGGASAVPAGMPVGGMAGRLDSAAATPKYGFKPTVVIHPVAAG